MEFAVSLLLIFLIVSVVVYLNHWILNGKLTPFMPLVGMITGVIVAKIINFLF